MIMLVSLWFLFIHLFMRSVVFVVLLLSIVPYVSR